MVISGRPVEGGGGFYFGGGRDKGASCSWMALIIDRSRSDTVKGQAFENVWCTHVDGWCVCPWKSFLVGERVVVSLCAAYKYVDVRRSIVGVQRQSLFGRNLVFSIELWLRQTVNGGSRPVAATLLNARNLEHVWGPWIGNFLGAARFLRSALLIAAFNFDSIGSLLAQNIYFFFSSFFVGGWN